MQTRAMQTRAAQKWVDLAIIAVPEALALPAVEACAAKSVRAAILFTSGFAEVSQDGRRAQQAITAVAREAGIRLLGPNCMGLINFVDGVVATFHLGFGPGLAPPGRIGLVTQSGAFGGLAYQVAQRRKEIGIRLALGSDGRRIFSLIVSEGLRLLAAGVGVGLAGAFAIRTAVATQLYDVQPMDPIVLALVVAVLAVVAFLACAVPARRAARIDPLVALTD